MFPRQCLGCWRVTAFRWSSYASPSACSVLCRKGQAGVNVTFYLLISHRRRGLALKRKAGEGKRDRLKEGQRGRRKEGHRGIRYPCASIPLCFLERQGGAEKAASVAAVHSVPGDRHSLRKLLELCSSLHAVVRGAHTISSFIGDTFCQYPRVILFSLVDPVHKPLSVQWFFLFRYFIWGWKGYWADRLEDCVCFNECCLHIHFLTLSFLP